MSHWPRTSTYFLSFIGCGMMGGVLGPALLYLSEHTGSSLSEIATVFTAKALGGMVGAFLMGFFYDRFPAHRVGMFVVAMGVFGLALIPSSPSLWVMLIFITMMGFGEASLNAGGNTMLVWLHRHDVGPFVNILHFCYGVGNMLIPLIILFAAEELGFFGWGFWAIALILAPVFFLMWRLPSPQNVEHEAEQAGVDRMDLFVAMFFLAAIYVGVEVSFAGWIPTYGVQFGLAKEESTPLVTLYWVTLSIGRLALIPVILKMGPRRFLFTCLTGSVLVLLAFMVLPAQLHVLQALTLLLGASLASIFPTLFALASRLIRFTGKRMGTILLPATWAGCCSPPHLGP